MRPNPFRVWLRQHGIRSAHVARALKIAPSNAWRWEQDDYLPTDEIMIRIFNFTQGAVRPEDFPPLVESTARASGPDCHAGAMLLRRIKEENEIAEREKGKRETKGPDGKSSRTAAD